MTADASEDVAKEQKSSIACGIASWYNHSGNQSSSFSENWTQYYLRTQLYHSWAYTQKMLQHVIRTDKCSTMFIAALFIIARSWKYPRCPSIEEWIQKMWYIYTGEYYSVIKQTTPMNSRNFQANGWNQKISSSMRYL